jgi:hypothetical protein
MDETHLESMSFDGVDDDPGATVKAKSKPSLFSVDDITLPKPFLQDLCFPIRSNQLHDEQHDA